MSDDASVLLVKDKVARYLGELTPTGYTVLPSGFFAARHGSTSLFVACRDLGAGLTSVEISAVVLRQVVPTARLFEYMVVNAGRFRFGRMEIQQSDVAGCVDIMYHHALLGDYLDQEEFNVAISIVGHAADELDNEMQAMFGGRRLYEDGP
jgi:T3SS (YopN, CesT) and YbjN peptide-binding chaperone 1